MISPLLISPLLAFQLATTSGPERATAVANLEKCIADVSVTSGNCNHHPLERVIELYHRGDHSLLALILRSSEIAYSGTSTNPGNIYLELLSEDQNQFLDGLNTLPDKERQKVAESIGNALDLEPDSKLASVRGWLQNKQFSFPEARKELLYQIDLKNIFRLQPYFPKETFSGLYKESDKFHQQWYGGQLFALGEQPIFGEQLAPGNAEYRFLWVRSFHHPVSVRLRVFPDGTGFVTLKESSGAGGYNPGTLTKNNTAFVESKTVQIFVFFLEKRAKFWDSSTELVQDCSKSCTIGTDGAQWIFEANREGKYHIVDRWSAEGPLREAGIILLNAAGYKVAKEDIY